MASPRGLRRKICGSISLSCNARIVTLKAAHSLTTLHRNGLAAKSLAAPHVAPFGSSPLGIKKHPFQGAFLWRLREDSNLLPTV